MTEEDKKILEQAAAIKKKEATIKSKKKKGYFMKGIIICVFLFLFAYTCTVLWLFYKTGNEPGVLTGSVFAACLGEFNVLGSIKKTRG